MPEWRKKSLGWYAGCVAVCLAIHPSLGWSVVGQAEKFDPFKEEDLREFHDTVIREEDQKQALRKDEMAEQLQEKEKSLKNMKGPDAQVAQMKIQELRRQLLAIPKRDRFKLETGGSYKFDTNVDRHIINEEKNDSMFDSTIRPTFDLSGRKTDIRFEFSGAKQWNIEFPEKDTWDVGERLRYRRKYFKKVIHSTQSALMYNNSKTIEIDDSKKRWDSSQNQSFNWAFSRKFSINNDFNLEHHIFPQEVFDQDSSSEATASPSIFWVITPKSRVSLGYNVGENFIESKTGNRVSHQVSAGYFGQVTRKSSTSLTISKGHQSPRDKNTAKIKTVSVGLGYILQLTAKTQATLQAVRSQQNSTSTLVGETGSTDDKSAQATKTESYFTNDSLSFSLNSRLNARLSVVTTLNLSRLMTKVETDGIKDSETMQITFPASLSLNYVITTWLRLNVAYTFGYRVGNEHIDFYRSHLIETAIQAQL